MTTHTGARVGVSTYSLSRNLGATYRDIPGGGERTRQEAHGGGNMTLLELPARIAAAGIHSLEISHPHLPSRETSYLNELRGALEAAGVQLFSVLIETGDMTHPDHAQRDLEWMAGWMETASQLGAERARVIAGHAAYTPETLQRSKCGLEELAERGKDLNVRVTTENWFDLLATPTQFTRSWTAWKGASASTWISATGAAYQIRQSGIHLSLRRVVSRQMRFPCALRAEQSRFWQMPGNGPSRPLCRTVHLDLQ